MASLAILLFTVESWCRLMSPPSLVDVRDLAEKAPLVFRGHVLTVTPIAANADIRLSFNELIGLAEPGARVGPSIAKIQVDRWYRGKGSTERCCALRIPDNIQCSTTDTIASISLPKRIR